MRVGYALLLSVWVGVACSSAHAQRYSLAGLVVDHLTNKPLAGATVALSKARAATVLTDEEGEFNFDRSLPGTYLLTVRYVGFLTYKKRLMFPHDTTIVIRLVPFTQQLDEVAVHDKAPTAVEDGQVSVHTLTARQLINVPSIGGEHDIIRTLTLLPGVKNDNDGVAGLYVRGGGNDQNLTLINGVPLYKNNHFLGFLSPLNSDAIQAVALYKGGFPARFGGRLSSVLDVNLKQASLNQVRVGGSVGILSSRLLVELPLLKERVSLLVAGRRSYFDLFTQLFTGSGTTEGPTYNFFDINALLTARLSSKNQLNLFAYQDKDKLTGAARTTIEDQEYNQAWNSRIAGLTLTTAVGSKWLNTAELNWSGYQMNQRIGRRFNNDTFSNTFKAAIDSKTLRNTTQLTPGTQYTLRVGLSHTWHRFQPGSLRYEGSNLRVAESNIDSLTTDESVLFMENEWKRNGLRLNAGWRVVRYGGATFSYLFSEPRLTATYQLSQRMAVKVGYARMHQPVHLLVNPGLGIPIDLWVSANNTIQPQAADQLTAGFATERFTGTDRAISLTIETYYKRLTNIISYKDGHSATDFTELSQQTTRRWESVVTSGQGQAYGAEMLLEKRAGRLTGWVGYTLAWATNRFDEINGGQPFFARQDRRHTLTVTGQYQLSTRWQVNYSWIIQSGQPVTLPKAVYNLPAFDFATNTTKNYANTIYLNGDRNAYRMRPYHRLDVSLQRRTTHRWGIGIWELTAYNLYNRRNPYFYYMDSGQKLYSVSLFAFIPSFSYTFHIYTKPH